MCPISAASEGTQDTVSCTPADQASAWKFLNFLFGDINSGYVEFRYFGPGRKPKVVERPAYLPLPLTQEQFASEVLAHNGQRMIAVGVAPRCRIPGRGSAAKDHDVLQVGCVWANLDNKDATGGAVEIIRRIIDLPLRPSVVVDTGYGYHVYYVFHSPLRAGRLVVWSELMTSLRDACYVDAKITLSQVMRLPGTLNIKEPNAVACEIVEEHSSWTRYSAEEVRESLEKRFTPGGAGGQPGNGTSRQLPSSQSAFSPDAMRQRGVPSEIVKAVVTGRIDSRSATNVGNYDGASGRDFWIASMLFAHGLNDDEIKAVFRAHPHGCGSNWAQKKDGEKYLNATIRKVKERHLDHSSLAEAREPGSAVHEAFAGNVLPPGYTQGDDGSVWFNPPVADTDKRAAPPVKVSDSLLNISEIQENIDTGRISLTVAFEYLGRRRSTLLQRSQVSNPRQLISALAAEGAPVSANNARLVVAYLTAYEHAFASTIPHKRVTSRFGRGRNHGPFFFPGLSSSTEFAPLASGDAALYRAYASRQGSLTGWLDAMHALADEALTIPQAAVLAAFVPPLQRRLQIPNFILDLHGDTSTGKSTALKLAASAYGRPHDPDSLILQWMNTQVAVEQVASVCGELPIFLDDAQHCPVELKRAVIYMIANGRGKGRGGRGGGISETATWHTVALSTSEEPLHEASPHEGARGRILPLGGATSPFPRGSAALVQGLEHAVAVNHGHAGELYLRHLNGWTDAEWFRWQGRYFGLRTELLKSSSSNLLGRVGGYIAAIQLAAEVVGPLLGLPFKPDVVGAWLKLHLDEQQADQNLVLAALRALADYYVANVQHFAGDGQHKRGAVFGAAKDGQYVGFLRSTVEAVFKPRRWHQTALLNKLAESGALLVTEGDRHSKKVSVGGIKHRMVCVKWSALQLGTKIKA
jgi:hypothetical protein